MMNDEVYALIEQELSGCLTVEELCETYADLYCFLNTKMKETANNLEVKDDEIG